MYQKIEDSLSKKASNIHGYSSISSPKHESVYETKGDYPSKHLQIKNDPSMRPFTGIDDIDLEIIASFLNTADKSRLARTSSRMLKFVSEHLERDDRKGESKRKTIRPPGPHFFRYKYRLEWGRSFTLCPNPGLLIAREADLGVSNPDPTLGCPILTPNGDRFLNLRGMMGHYPQLYETSHYSAGDILFFYVGKMCTLICCSPLLMLECCGISLGCIYGSYRDCHSPEVFSASFLHDIPVRRNPRYTSLAKQTAIQWADDFNPCGSQSIHPADCSFISPPAPFKSQCYNGDLICISDIGECQAPPVKCSDLAHGCMSNLPCCPVMLCCFTSHAAIASPCFISSCLGYVCGYTYGSIKDYHQQQSEGQIMVADQESAPLRQQMF